MSRIKDLLKTYDGTTADDYEYDGGDFDDAYENPDDHAEFCDCPRVPVVMTMQKGLNRKGLKWDAQP